MPNIRYSKNEHAALIHSFELYIGATLPDDYKTFLIEERFAEYSPGIFEFAEGNMPIDTTIRFFYKMNPEDEYRSIYPQTDLFKDHFPDRTIIPIVTDDGGGRFVMEHQDGIWTGVFFTDFWSGYNDYLKVADSFTEFLNGIRLAD